VNQEIGVEELESRACFDGKFEIGSTIRSTEAERNERGSQSLPIPEREIGNGGNHGSDRPAVTRRAPTARAQQRSEVSVLAVLDDPEHA
jgi:hypothetical protein